MRRRSFLGSVAGAAVVPVAGCLHSDDYDPETVRSEAQVVAYDEMDVGDRIHVEHGRIRQSQVSAERYFIYTERDENDEWVNDVFGAWDGEEFEEDDEVEFWAVVEGTHTTEEGRELPNVTIVDMQRVGSD